jgi:hypothetical protein
MLVKGQVHDYQKLGKKSQKQSSSTSYLEPFFLASTASHTHENCKVFLCVQRPWDQPEERKIPDSFDFRM